MNPATARSLLFVPGTRPERFATAAASGADVVIVDLEDAVAPDDKGDARKAAAAWVQEHPAVVRINGAQTRWYAEDVAAVTGARQLRGVIVPKAEEPDRIAALVSALGDVPVLALVESAKGLRAVDAIAAVLGVARLLFGNLDYALDVGVTVRPSEEPQLLFARSALVNASRAAGLPGPVEGVSPAIADLAALVAATSRSIDLGFTGKLCIHPRHVQPIHDAMRPADEELAWAARVVEAAVESAGAAVRVDGEMVDRPRLELARRLLARAAQS